MTNREKLLKEMSDDELAKHFDNCAFCAYSFIRGRDSSRCNPSACHQGIVEWLQQEEDGDENDKP